MGRREQARHGRLGRRGRRFLRESLKDRVAFRRLLSKGARRGRGQGGHGITGHFFGEAVMGSCGSSPALRAAAGPPEV